MSRQKPVMAGCQKLLRAPQLSEAQSLTIGRATADASTGVARPSVRRLIAVEPPPLARLKLAANSLPPLPAIATMPGRRRWTALFELAL